MANRRERRRRAAVARIQAKAAAKTAPRPAEPRRIKGRLEFTAPVTIRAADGEGKQRRFEIVAYSGEPLRQWWSEYPIVPDLASMQIRQRMPILYDHRDLEEEVVGQSDQVTVVGSTLTVSGIVLRSSKRANAIVAKADEGYVWQASIGAHPGKREFIDAGATVTVNGRQYTGPIYVARGGELKETSIVVLGADGNTSALVASDQESQMDFDSWLLTMGFEDKESLTPVQLANLERMYNDEEEEEGTDGPGASQVATPANGSAAVTPATPTNAAAPAPQLQASAANGQPAPTPAAPANLNGRQPRVPGRLRRINASGGRRDDVDPVVSQRRAISAELQRTQAIGTICARYRNPEVEIEENGQRRRVNLQAHAVEHGWDVNRVELEALRNDRNRAPAVFSHSHNSTATLQALQGAMMLRAGARLDHPVYRTEQAVAMRVPEWLRAGLNDAQRNQFMEAAHQFADMSMVDLCREALRLDGKDAPRARDEMIQAAVSGGNLTNIFTTNINTVILTTYVQAPDTTEGWVRPTDVADFKLNERPRMVKGPSLTKLPRGQEADHASRSDLEEKYKIARYAKQFVVDEQDIIDDRFNALADTPREFGQAAARLRPDLVYAILLANPTLNATSLALFTASNATSNLLTTNALAAAALRSAVAQMMLIQENGVNLNLMASHIIVPPALKFLAKELAKAGTIIIAGTAGSVTERGSVNTLADEGLQPVIDARLQNGVTDPNSGTTYAGSSSTWFLASAMAQTIEVAYLRGTGRAPQVRPFVLDKGKWGIGWDCKLDIGAAAMDWRGLQKNTA